MCRACCCFRPTSMSTSLAGPSRPAFSPCCSHGSSPRSCKSMESGVAMLISESFIAAICIYLAHRAFVRRLRQGVAARDFLRQPPSSPWSFQSEGQNWPTLKELTSRWPENFTPSRWRQNSPRFIALAILTACTDDGSPQNVPRSAYNIASTSLCGRRRLALFRWGILTRENSKQFRYWMAKSWRGKRLAFCIPGTGAA